MSIDCIEYEDWWWVVEGGLVEIKRGMMSELVMILLGYNISLKETYKFL